jgi:cold shock protein
MSDGTIARLTDRGFGFIARDGEEKDLFFHANELQGVTFDELNEGDKVTFEVADGDKGPSATKVSRAETKSKSAPLWGAFCIYYFLSQPSHLQPLGLINSSKYSSP